MKIKKNNFMVFAIVVIALFTSCKKDKVEENNEEVITTLKVKLVPVGGGSPLEFMYDDPDGPGGNAPTKQTIALQANKTYTVSLEVLNKTTNPVTDVTADIVAEANAHRFYYTPAAGSNITVNNLNNDGNGVALGTTSNWVTTATATGKIVVTLRHYAGNPPDKAAADLVNSSKSSTDIEVEFNTTIN
jgi:hypothetical protein